jgi:hypothetical protein
MLCVLQWRCSNGSGECGCISQLLLTRGVQSAALFDACTTVAARRRGHGFLRQKFRCARHFFVCKTNKRTNNTQARNRSTQLKCSSEVCHTEQLLCEDQSATNRSADLKERTLLLSMTVGATVNMTMCIQTKSGHLPTGSQFDAIIDFCDAYRGIGQTPQRILWHFAQLTLKRVRGFKQQQLLTF